MKSIVINLDSKCNASCAHCCFSCSPNSSEHLTKQEIDNIVKEINKHKELKQVAITGGEPLLRYSEVIKVVAATASLGKDVTLITNGYWAVNEKIAEEKIDKLVNCGLSALTVSYDNYHREFIPVERIRILFNVLKRYNLSTALNMVVDKENRATEIIEELEESIFGVPITIMPVSRVGNACLIDERNLYFTSFSNYKKLECPASAWEFVVHHDGLVYPCCSPLVFDSNLVIGDIRKETIADIEKSLFSNILLLIIKEQGLGWFIKKLSLDVDLDHFVSVCEICRIIFSSTERINEIYDDIMKYHEGVQESLQGSVL